MLIWVGKTHHSSLVRFSNYSMTKLTYSVGLLGSSECVMRFISKFKLFTLVYGCSIHSGGGSHYTQHLIGQTFL